MSNPEKFPNRRAQFLLLASTWTLAMTLSLSTGCKNTDIADPGIHESTNQEANDFVGEVKDDLASNEEKLPQSPTPFRIVRVDNDLDFAILQNVNGLFPEAGTELDVYRGSEVVGRLKAGSQAEETFFSADIIEGTIRDTDIAFRFSQD